MSIEMKQLTIRILLISIIFTNICYGRARVRHLLSDDINTPINIFVNGCGFHQKPVEVLGDGDVAFMRDVISTSIEIPITRFDLMWRGERLTDNDAALADLGIGPEADIQINPPSFTGTLDVKLNLKQEAETDSDEDIEWATYNIYAVSNYQYSDDFDEDFQKEFKFDRQDDAGIDGLYWSSEEFPVQTSGYQSHDDIIYDLTQKMYVTAKRLWNETEGWIVEVENVANSEIQYKIRLNKF